MPFRSCFLWCLYSYLFHKNTILYIAIQKGNLEIINQLLSNQRIDVNIKSIMCFNDVFFENIFLYHFDKYFHPVYIIYI